MNKKEKEELIKRLKNNTYDTSDLMIAESEGMIRRIVDPKEIGCEKEIIKSFLG